MLGLRFQISQNRGAFRFSFFSTAFHRVLHIECRIQLRKPLTFCCKLRFLGEWFSKFRLCRFLLIVEIGQLFIGSFQPLRNAGKGVIQSGDISSGIRTKGYIAQYPSEWY